MPSSQREESGDTRLKLRFLPRSIFAAPLFLFFASHTFAQDSLKRSCTRAPEGSAVSNPKDLASENGVLKVDLAFRSSSGPNGSVRYCYVSPDGSQAPTLRLKPGDLLVLNLANEVDPTSPRPTKHMHALWAQGPCAHSGMIDFATNLHFHGLSVPPVCHQDEAVSTHILPFDPPFEYRIRIPSDQPPGMYWYHPHPHGASEAQVLGGASGVLLVEGLEQINPKLAGLPERILVIRDGALVHPDAEPKQSPSMPAPIVLRDAEGDILNSGTGSGKPAKDLSLNFVPVPFPTYEPAILKIKPHERELWRVLNASADTYLDLQLLFGDTPQPLGIVAFDGMPFGSGGTPRRVLWQTHIALPPAGRTEFVVNGPSEETHATFVTRSVDTGPAGENDPTRPLAVVIPDVKATDPSSSLDTVPHPLPMAQPTWLADLKPARERLLSFSEKPHDATNPNGPIDYFLTVDGQLPAVFDPASGIPNIVVHSGDVEDWTIENHTQELHAFHIHQIHFLLIGWNGVPVDEPFLRDTVNVAYWDGKSPLYPSVKLRMDFRDANIAGDFVYHCHILEHEDGGMMGLIRVLPRLASH